MKSLLDYLQPDNCLPRATTEWEDEPFVLTVDGLTTLPTIDLAAEVSELERSASSSRHVANVS